MSDRSAGGYTEVQERLLRATLETIDQVGIGNATTRLIARRAGVNLQLIQYHFGGKEAMIQEAQSYIVERFFEAVGPVIAGAPSLTEAIRRGVAATWELARSQPEIVQPDLLLQTVRAGQQSPQRRQRETQRRLVELLAQVAGRTGEQLTVPVEQFALLAISGLGGLVLEYRATGRADRVGPAVRLFGELLVTLVDHRAPEQITPPSRR